MSKKTTLSKAFLKVKNKFKAYLHERREFNRMNENSIKDIKKTLKLIKKLESNASKTIRINQEAKEKLVERGILR